MEELLTLSNRTTMMVGLLFWLALAIWVWTFIDLFKLNKGRHSNNASLWFLIILVFPILGPILYFQMGRSNLKYGKRKFGDRRFNPKFRN